jgi:hypothetical protein
MADITTDEYYPGVTLNFTTTGGQPATVQPGSIVWASSDETVVVVQNVAADGMTADVMTVAPSTSPARVSVTCDADLGSGVNTITGVSEDINVTLGASSQASVITFTFPAPAPKPVVQPVTP